MDNEKELQDLTERVIAAGGRAGRKAGVFLLDLLDGDGCKRGDEHPEVMGLYFWARANSKGLSRWVDAASLTGARASLLDNKKKWRQENPDKVAAQEKRYREANRDRLREYNRRWREANPEEYAESRKRWRENNKEKIAEYQKGWREENRGRVSEYERGYREENKEKRSAHQALRRARLREAIDPAANKAIVNSRYAAAQYLRDVTGENWEVDHTEPLSDGGKHHEDNLQVVPAIWNSGKCNHHNDRWFEDSDIYRYATAVEKRFEREAIAAQGD